MPVESITGPTRFEFSTGQSTATAQYVASKSPVTWSVTVVNDYSLSPGDYTITISSTGLVTVTIKDGVAIPPGGIQIDFAVRATRLGGGVGNTDTLIVTVTGYPGVPCFTPGTMILTPGGERSIETLSVGDEVLTHTGGRMTVRHILTRTIPAERLRADPRSRPVRIRRGAFGDAPHSDLRVSPFHRILLSGWRAELYCGTDEVLAHAIHLVGDETITQDPPGEDVTYIHLVLDTHAVLVSNGLPTESLHLGEMSLRYLDREDRKEMERIFGEEVVAAAHADSVTSLTCATRAEAALLR
ncbi:Hint domain-containing protein [Ostreiculturibacter nitratireducens]|uniref:Hint domain-containing protein n=1 Tax=Ostreiculturibacter nitratireducens TaxID=3075226 RepID=UPI0031B57A78